VVDALNT